MKKILLAGIVTFLVASAGFGLRMLWNRDGAAAPATPSLEGSRVAGSIDSAATRPLDSHGAGPAVAAGVPNEARDPGSGNTAALILDEAARGAGNDPAATLAWAATLEPHLARSAADVVLNHWIANDPQAAFDAAFALEETGGGLRAYALMLVIDRWSGLDPDAAWTAAGSLEEARMRAFAEASVMTKWAGQDPAQAAAALDAAREFGESSSVEVLANFHMQIAASFALRDAPGARSWVESLPAGKARDSATLGLLEGWARIDPKAASEWLNTQPAGPSRDRGIRSLVFSVESEDPPGALYWASTIDDPSIRTLTLMSSAHRWLTLHPEQARTWLEEESGLPTAEVAEILTTFQKLEDGSLWQELEAAKQK